MARTHWEQTLGDKCVLMEEDKPKKREKERERERDILQLNISHIQYFLEDSSERVWV